MKPRNVLELLNRWEKKHPHKLAYTYIVGDGEEKEAITFQELLLRVKSIAAFISEKTEPESFVMLMYQPGIHFITGFLGCLYAKVTAVPVYPPRKNSSLERVQSIYQDCSVSLILSESEAIERIKHCFTGEDWIDVDKIYATDVISREKYSEWKMPDITSQTLAFLQYTSGSTGTPKGVMVSHGNLLANEITISEKFSLNNKTVVFGWLPQYHDMGLIGLFMQPVVNGASLYFMSPFDFIQKPLRWLQGITKYKATLSGGPNFGYQLCVDTITEEEIKNLDLSTWQNAFNGAEPVQNSTIQSFTQKFARCGFHENMHYPCYGLAEATLFMTGMRTLGVKEFLSVSSEDLKNKKISVVDLKDADSKVLVSCGGCTDNHYVRICNTETGEICKDDTIGEIIIAGPSISRGYWNRKEINEEFFNVSVTGIEHPFFKTGDLGFVNNGNLYVTGRIKDLMIINGKNHYPHDIELTIEKKYAEVNAMGVAAFSIASDKGETITLVVEVKRSAIKKLEDVKFAAEICATVTKEHDVGIEQIIFVKPTIIPKTSSGKTRRSKTKEMLLSDTLPYITRWSKGRILEGSQKTNGNIEQKQIQCKSSSLLLLKEKIKLFVSKEVGIEVSLIGDTDPFVQFGVDSVKGIRILAQLAEALGVVIEETALYDYPDVQLLAEYINTLNVTESIITANEVQAEINSDILDDIAIIGMAGYFPGADSVDEFWDILQKNECSISEVPTQRWNIDNYYHTKKCQGKMITRWGGWLKSIDTFDPLFFNISPKEAEAMDPQQRLALKIAYHTFENAGYTAARLNGSDLGVYLGVSNTDYTMIPAEREKRYSEYYGVGNASSIVANRISYTNNLIGPSVVVDTACSSSLVSVHLAATAIKNGECSAALAGGVNVILNPDTTVSFSQNGMMAPDGLCKTFDESANGYVRSEGCGMVLLKKVSQAEKDGDRILAIVKGSAINQDGKSNGITAPNGPSQLRVIEKALKNGNISADEIGYVEAHGTGTSLGDPIEVTALKKVYGKKKECFIGSCKTNIGHLESAAGIAGLVKAVYCVKKGIIPGNPQLQIINSRIDLSNSKMSLVRNTIPWNSSNRYAGVSAFAFGGTNAHIIIKDYSECQKRMIGITCFMLSAKSWASLKQNSIRISEYIIKYKEHFDTHESLAALCVGSQFSKTEFRHRIAFFVNTPDELIKKLKKFIGAECTDICSDTASTLSISEGVSRQLNADWLVKMQAWLDGKDVDFRKVYPAQVQFEPLPGFVYDEEKYWIAEMPEISDKQSSAVILNECMKKSSVSAAIQNVSTLDKCCFVLDTQKFFGESYNINTGTLLHAVIEMYQKVANTTEISIEQCVFYTSQIPDVISVEFKKSTYAIDCLLKKNETDEILGRIMFGKETSTQIQYSENSQIRYTKMLSGADFYKLLATSSIKTPLEDQGIQSLYVATQPGEYKCELVCNTSINVFVLAKQLMQYYATYEKYIELKNISIACLTSGVMLHVSKNISRLVVSCKETDETNRFIVSVSGLNSENSAVVSIGILGFIIERNEQTDGQTRILEMFKNNELSIQNAKE